MQKYLLLATLAVLTLVPDAEAGRRRWRRSSCYTTYQCCQPCYTNYCYSNSYHQPCDTYSSCHSDPCVTTCSSTGYCGDSCSISSAHPIVSAHAEGAVVHTEDGEAPPDVPQDDTAAGDGDPELAPEDPVAEPVTDTIPAPAP